MKHIYLDYAATTPMSASVQAAMAPFYSEAFYNPSALYLAAKEVRKQLEAARETAAQLLQVRPSELVFTAGTTEANNMVIHGVMRQFPDGDCVVSAIEHDSVLGAAQVYSVRVAPVRENGIIDVDGLVAQITDTTVLVSCMLANNEIGTVQPVAEVVARVQAIRALRAKAGNSRPLYVHTDAAQAFNYMRVLPHALGVDFLVLSGSKTYGPKQMALLFVKVGSRLQPQVVGGGQEWGQRAGTENVAASIGLVAALQEADSLRATEQKRMRDLQQHFFAALEVQIPDARINGSRKTRLPNNVHITIPGSDNETLVMQLDEAGIMAAAGSACSASSDEPSHVLRACGLDTAAARSSLRFTMGRDTTKTMIDTTVNVLQKLVSTRP